LQPAGAGASSLFLLMGRRLLAVGPLLLLSLPP
jgi:hypothetical protein